MNAERLDEIKKRCEAATPGPWKSGSYDSGVYHSEIGAIAYAEYSYELDDPYANAEFIAHSREDIPALLEENAKLRAALKDLLEVEWVSYSVGYAVYSSTCPWCKAPGHLVDCPRQKAAALLEEVQE